MNIKRRKSLAGGWLYFCAECGVELEREHIDHLLHPVKPDYFPIPSILFRKLDCKQIGKRCVDPSVDTFDLTDL